MNRKVIFEQLTIDYFNNLIIMIEDKILVHY